MQLSQGQLDYTVRTKRKAHEFAHGDVAFDTNVVRLLLKDVINTAKLAVALLDESGLYRSAVTFDDQLEVVVTWPHLRHAHAHSDSLNHIDDLALVTWKTHRILSYFRKQVR